MSNADGMYVESSTIFSAWFLMRDFGVSVMPLNLLCKCCCFNAVVVSLGVTVLSVVWDVPSW